MGRLTAATQIGPSTEYVVTDYEHPDPEVGRVVLVEFNGLTIRIGDAWGAEQDASIIEACNALISAFATVREAAHERMHAEAVPA